MTLDRINNDGNYEPGNCRWTSKKEQSRNTMTNRPVSHNGETKILIEWCEDLNVHKSTLFGRLKRMPVSEAITGAPSLPRRQSDS